MEIHQYVALSFLFVGVLFFIAGAFGLLRFPDTYSRLHALTKADNIGLGFIILGIAIEMGDLSVFIKLVLVWVLIIFSSATSCYLIARAALRMDKNEQE